MNTDLHSLPAWPQTQAPLADQIADVVRIANRLGFYDAASAIEQLIPRLSTVRYGCHVDLADDQEPDDCVIDFGDFDDCIHAKEGMRKEQCKYWRVCKPREAGR